MINLYPQSYTTKLKTQNFYCIIISGPTQLHQTVHKNKKSGQPNYSDLVSTKQQQPKQSSNTIRLNNNEVYVNPIQLHRSRNVIARSIATRTEARLPNQ